MLKARGESSGETGIKLLLEAMSNDQVHLARFVLDALDGEIVDTKTKDAQTPLIVSILLPEGRTRCKFVELLLQRGASVNRQDGNGRTALSYACENGYLDAVKILVQNNADPEIDDTWGNTALMYAVVAGHAAVVEFLVRAFKRLGLQIDRQNKVGNSAANVAQFLGHTKCLCALQSASRKNSVAEKDGQGARQQRLAMGAVCDRFDNKVGYLVKKVDLLQTNDRETLQTVPNTFLPQRYRQTQSGLPSMGSIEESETENDASSTPTKLDLSGVLNPKPAQRPTAADDCRPPLTQNTIELGAPTPLSILMIPISEKDRQITKTPDCGVHRFHDSYFQKRCSLPTSSLRPAPPERTLEPVRKSKTVKKRDASLSRDVALQSAPQTASASNTTFSALSDKLFRRFTSPEFKKNGKMLEEEPVRTPPGRMPRSETFPRDIAHPQVGSKPSIDSISSVLCEFDCQLRTHKL